MSEQQKPERSKKDWRAQHLWQFQPIRDLLVVLGIFGILYLGYALRLVTVPLLVALLLAYLFDPLVRRMARARWLNRNGAVVIILAIVVLLGAGFVTGLGYASVRAVGFLERQANFVQIVWTSLEDAAPDATETERNGAPNGAGAVEGETSGDTERDERSVSEEEAGGPEAAPREPWRDRVPPFWEKTRDLIAENEEFQKSDVFAGVERWVEEHRGDIAAAGFQTVRGALQWIAGTLSSVGVILFGAFLTGFFYFFFATAYPRVLHHGDNVIPDRYRDETIYLLTSMDNVIAGFVRGRITIAAIQFVIFTVAYWLIGVPLPFVVGFVVAVLSIVPYLALVGIPLSVGLMLMQPSPVEWQNAVWWSLSAPIVVYFAGQALDDYVWTPLIQGRSTNMDTPTILFASLSGGVLAGVYGLLLGIPVAACAKILLTELAWPRFKAWTEGRAPDPLPIGRDQDEDDEEDS